MKKVYEISILFIACLTILVIFLFGMFMLVCGINSIIGFEMMFFFMSLKMALYKSILMVLFGALLICVALFITFKNIKK